jgi:hypothetical protein
MIDKFDVSKRPKVGIGIMICNEFNEVIACERKPKKGSSDGLQLAFPGGW